MDVRGKLVELIEQSGACFNCFPVAGYEKDEIEKIALHLIAHGVTVQDKTEITDEILNNLRNAPITVSYEEPTVEVVQEWISVKDRLPDMNEEVFAVYKNSLFENGPKFTKVLHRESKHWVGRNGYRYLYENITHWMPLPQPPKGE